MRAVPFARIAILFLGLVGPATLAGEDLVPRLEGCCFILDFEDAAPGECLNEKYADLGLHMFRGDRGCIRARDVDRLGWWTPTPPMAASTTSDGDGFAPFHSGTFYMQFDRPASMVFACFGNDGPGMSLEYRCDRNLGWSGGYGPLNGNFDLDQQAGAYDCDSVWFQDRFRNYAVTLDRLQISFCEEPRTCTVVGDGPPEIVELEPGTRWTPCDRSD